MRGGHKDFIYFYIGVHEIDLERGPGFITFETTDFNNYFAILGDTC